MRDTHILRLGAVDLVAQDPAAGRAMRIHTAAAIFAATARGDAGDEHAVARMEHRHAGPNLLDRSGFLVTEDASRGGVWDVAFENMEIRAAVTRPLATGILVVDAMIPLGRGQRELNIGDRETGKTAIAVDAIINQRSTGVICVYAAVGQRISSVAQVIEAVRRYGTPEHCLFVVGEANAAPGLQWLTPYAACAMAEHFMRGGRDVLLVIDDLTKHAAVYRQVSLLLRRPPGREAFPGDIFYIHSRLLERSAKLAPVHGGGSLTALPIAETQAGNMSAYIPTNLISITDGQIYLDPRLFYEDQKSAIDVGKSVSRVGGKAQSPILKAASESLRLDYAQFLELEVFTRFGGSGTV